MSNEPKPIAEMRIWATPASEPGKFNVHVTGPLLNKAVCNQLLAEAARAVDRAVANSEAEEKGGEASRIVQPVPRIVVPG